MLVFNNSKGLSAGVFAKHGNGGLIFEEGTLKYKDTEIHDSKEITEDVRKNLYTGVLDAAIRAMQIGAPEKVKGSESYKMVKSDQHVYLIDFRKGEMRLFKVYGIDYENRLIAIDIYKKKVDKRWGEEAEWQFDHNEYFNLDGASLFQIPKAIDFDMGDVLEYMLMRLRDYGFEDESQDYREILERLNGEQLPTLSPALLNYRK